MKEIQGNIWDYHDKGWIVIPTNGALNSRGECVMGRGLAYQAKLRYPKMPLELGGMIRQYGNHICVWQNLHLVSFPVKHNWWEKADPILIAKSVDELEAKQLDARVYMPRVGCGNGQLDWFMVRPIIATLDDQYIVVDIKGGQR